MSAASRTVSAGQANLEALLKAFSEVAAGPPGAAQTSLLEQVIEDYEADETPEVGLKDLAALINQAWQQASKREAGSQAFVTVGPLNGADGRATGYDQVLILQDDAPFLVDSVLGELADAGVTVRALYHPVVEMGAGRRDSLIILIIDPLPQERRDVLGEGLASAMADVRLAVQDHARMVEAMKAAIGRLEAETSGRIDPAVREENIAFLRWVKSDHFVFLGARDYDFPVGANGELQAEAPMSENESGMGILSDPERRVLRRASEPAVLTPAMKQQMDHSDPVTVAKSNLRSRVHRRAVMDYIGVKRYDAQGRAVGETRFVGLFTAEAYDKMAKEVPLIRRKVANALQRAEKAEGSHSYKRLKNILENYPRDELFQISEDELLDTALGILHLYDRPRISLFTRRDPFDRFVSVLAFIPRERFDATLRARIGNILADAWGGRVSAWYPQLSDQPLTRVHYIIGVTPGDHPTPDANALEAAVAEAGRSWIDRFESALRAADVNDVAVGPISAKWADSYGAGYRDRYDATEAVADLGQFDRLNDGSVADGITAEPVAVRAFRTEAETSLQFRFKLYRRGSAVPLSDVLPILADMGLKTLEESDHVVRPQGDEPIYIHDFLLEDPRGDRLDFADIKAPFEAAFAAVWNGRTESDGFNRLVLELGIDWREAALIRTLARYRQQTGLDPSQSVQELALREYPQVSRAILSLFATKFDPAKGGDAASREAGVAEVQKTIATLLQDVASLDHDRALRRIADLVGALKRTNFYQGKPHISIKIAPREIEDMPLPKPFREIFVWAPHVEGAHLRFGPVARGGLRWSDRRDDYRTEVLGLVKAQQVKNSVIVPVGSKGGFYPKQLPVGGDRDAMQAEAIRAYKTFLSGMLDITDNIVGDGAPVRPENVIAWEGDDPYLVVAADKGTATFSDIANSVSQSYGFWLDDAFASGGSAGYDHKEMGITARGAWEAVKRHFRETGKDIQSEPFTVVGVGDMSGDVFGNGMLLSKAIKLVAAFDHRDIFLDPNPDPAKSWEERNRLFNTPRTSWQDYDKSLISEGGAVFSRSAKTITLTPQIKAMLDIEVDTVDPVTLMQAILKARAELLYFGGIGTYIKGAGETNAQAGDKANDAIRINGGDVRAQVVGEGANLGMTQLGRIEAARAGARLNTDAIDNSAGVDSSDQEVNIKILTGGAIASGHLKTEDRNALLKSMTDEVAEKVLAHNYDQTLAVTLQQAEGAAALEAQQAFMQHLTSLGKLNRAVEYLPDDARIAEMKLQGTALTRPELAVLTAYSKLELFDEIVASAAPDDAFFEHMLVHYFPTPLAKFEEDMKGHRLRRDIIATVLSNEIVNMAGATFPDRLRAAAECDTAAMVTAFETARQVFRLDQAWKDVSALDLKIPAEAQTALYREIALVLRRQTYWLARRAARTETTVGSMIAAYQPAADALRAAGPDVLSRYEQDRYESRVATFVGLGAPEALARDIAMLRPMVATADIGDLTTEMGWSAPAMARLYHQIGAAFDFDRLRVAAGSIASGDHFDRLAVRRLIQDLMAEQQQLTRAVAASVNESVSISEADAEAAVDNWIGDRLPQVEALRASVDGIETSGAGWTFAKLTIANSGIREVLTSAA
ncbi:NAD-glutamate dehydrogenase [Brevundimonas terrae]|uniref:NAD-glutamate dehydrogenase n=1 Tax=Brevundimonas terrae TaxID=363631 RepID=A0ABP3HUK8_9CAUL|nr:NAD-glutamate dehydrogenase [Brevundimonas terrae]NIJ25943.1 glutamate dehydrogenase [Brevundimonas terrae]